MAGKRTRRNKGRRGARRAPREMRQVGRGDVEGGVLGLVRPEFQCGGPARSPRDESRLRHAYMVWEEGWRKRTARSSRAGLGALASAGSFVGGGVEMPVVWIEGDAAGVREFPDGKVRLMLSLPRGPEAGTGCGILVDDHLWLDVRDMAGCQGRRAEVRYGDVVRIAANLRSYEGRDGSRRLGVGDWWLVESRFEYRDASAGRTRELKPLFGDESLLLRATCDRPGSPDGKLVVDVVSQAAFEGYLSELAERWKSAEYRHLVGA